MTKEKLAFTDEKVGFYKGYAIEWLRKEPSHPEFGLVAEYDLLHAPKEEVVEEEKAEEKKPEKAKKKAK